MEIPEDIRFSARIDGWGFEKMDGKSTVLYNIMIMSSNGHSWTVRRRYSEFRDNYLTIQYQFKHSKAAKFSFPRKTIIKTVNNADTRKDILQKYLNDLLEIRPVPVEVKYFLRITPKVLCLEDSFGSPSPSSKASNSPYSYKNGTPGSDHSMNTPGSLSPKSDRSGDSPRFATPSDKHHSAGACTCVYVYMYACMSICMYVSLTTELTLKSNLPQHPNIYTHIHTHIHPHRRPERGGQGRPPRRGERGR